MPCQVSPWDCTGCELCVRICPADALKLADAAKVIEAQPGAQRCSWCLELISEFVQIISEIFMIYLPAIKHGVLENGA